jgi:hypothetical protein
MINRGDQALQSMAAIVPLCSPSVATRKFLNHLRPSFTFLPRWNISS